MLADVQACSRCGLAAPDADALPLGWSAERDGRGVRWLCAGCTREHVRSIEAKLDEGWW